MLRKNYLGVKLSEAEERALILWASSEGIDNKSTMMRRLFRLALRSAPRSIFPPDLISQLNIDSNIAIGDATS